MEDESEVIDACIKLMREWKLGFLTTLDQSGTPQTRYLRGERGERGEGRGEKGETEGRDREV